VNAYTYFPKAVEIEQDYAVEVLRQSCSSFNRIIAIVKNDMIDNYEESWKQLKGDVVPLKKFFDYPVKINILFVDYMKKMSAIDIILGNHIEEFWIRNGSFPYDR
jgi:hypothetical protein